MTKIKGIAEIVLNVHDMPASLKFYQEVLGLEIIGRPGPVFLRAGYSTFGKNFKAGLESGKDNLAGFSGGVGVIVQKFQVDYAFLPYSTLGSVHRFSGAYRF